MFFPSDPFSEIVVHFLGYFEIAVEDMRIRLELEQVEREAEAGPQAPQMQQISIDVVQAHVLGAYMPGVHYVPPGFLIRGEAHFGPQDISLPGLPDFANPHFDRQPVQELPEGPDAYGPLIGPEPGSLIAVITQQVTLYDDDIFVMGTLDEPVVFNSGADAGLIGLHAASSQVLGPMADGPGMHGYDDVPLVMDAVDALALAQQSNANGQVNTVENIEGTYVNGELADEAPVLEDALPDHLKAEEDDETDPHTIEVTDEEVAHVDLSGDELQGSVTYNSGGNYLLNEAHVANAGVVGTHFVVGGDFHQLDAIVQTNAYRDKDTVSDDFPLAAKTGGTNAFNIASFVQETLDTAGDIAKASPGIMPLTWQISIVKGDIIFLEWMKQLTFMSDQDMGVLSATGSNMVVTSGENIGFNGISFANFGSFFDLILVGGNVYDANIIVQNNILYDNDTIAMLGEGDGDYAAGGSLNTSGNLLWNQATIHNIGATEIEGISDTYKSAMDGLANGNKSMPTSYSFAKDFEGIAVPKVLYISGSIYDMRYIEQTNILGDADFVALQKSAFLAGQPATEWNIDTGSNALVNIASIKDYDTYGNTIEVGGNHYSDAVLIQADILQANDGDGDPDALVTEVVAFLDYSEMPLDAPDYATGDLAHDGAPVDVMQAVLA